MPVNVAEGGGGGGGGGGLLPPPDDPPPPHPATVVRITERITVSAGRTWSCLRNIVLSLRILVIKCDLVAVSHQFSPFAFVFSCQMLDIVLLERN